MRAVLTSDWAYERIRWPFRRFIAMRFYRSYLLLGRVGNWCNQQRVQWTPEDGKGPTTL